jgi:ABC-type multidrug transport system fused ATPase/permease subunit
LLKNFKYLLKRIIFFFEREEKSSLIILSFLLLINGLLEIITLVTIGLFLKVITDLDYSTNNFLLNNICIFFDLDRSKIPIYFGILLSFLLIISSLSNLFVNIKTYKYISKISSSLSKKVFLYYLYENYSYHLVNGKNKFIKKITYDLDRLVNGVILIMLTLVSKVVNALFIISFLFYLNFFISLLIIILLSSFYLIFYHYIKNKLNKIGIILTGAQKEQLKILQESFGGIKEIKLTNSYKPFLIKYSEIVDSYNKNFSEFQKISQLPRSIIELISVLTIIFIILVLTQFYNQDIYLFLPILGIYALAGLKTIPTIQSIFQGVTQIKTFIPSLDPIHEDILGYRKLTNQVNFNKNEGLLNFDDSVTLKNIFYHYPLEKNNILENINLKIKKNQLISIVGPNGSGKTTLINLICGILKPQAGDIFVDNLKLSNKNILLWQQKIGYVSQDIFLFEDTILNNIIFGVKDSKFDHRNLNKIIEQIELDSFIKSLPHGINTKIGSSGIHLSGGQKQKISIARCLIRNVEIIILDEASSALDFQSELNFNNIINNFIGKKTLVVITHKFNSIKNSDVIYLMENGKIKKSGNYNDIFQL